MKGRPAAAGLYGFRGLRAAHDVEALRSATRRFRRPVAGRLGLASVRLAAEDDPGRGAVARFPEPGSLSQERLHRLVGRAVPGSLRRTSPLARTPVNNHAR
ncbi:MmyB family transcriptional regulator [Streptomyces sp. IBSBF 2435]|uniref:MmyB family transcriptional regulator n=1 Tax=Streptomyces sp. IBSBF 2435 TaxID=2903531 RepID=UPI003FA6C79C